MTMQIYKFTIVNGQITAAFDWDFEDRRFEPENMDADETWVLQGNQVVKTEVDDGRSQVWTFVDEDGDGIFVTQGFSQPDFVRAPDAPSPAPGPISSPSWSSQGYRFEFDATGRVVQIFELDDGRLELEPIDPDETYQLQADGTVLETELDDDGLEFTLYADADGDGVFHRVSETWQPKAESSSGLGRAITQELRFGQTDGDDWIAVRGGERCVGGQGSDRFVVREAAHLVIEDFSVQDGDRLVFDLGFGLRSSDQIAQAVTAIRSEGDTLVLEFGPSASITLVGVATQPDLGWQVVDVAS